MLPALFSLLALWAHCTSKQILYAPLSTPIHFTASVGDTISFPFSQMYSKSITAKTPLKLQIRGPQGEDLLDTVPNVRLISRTVLTAKDFPFSDAADVQFSGFECMLREGMGRFWNLCLFAWEENDADGRQEVGFGADWCLPLNIRVVNNSLDFTELANLTYGQELKIQTAANSQSLDLISFTKGLLPDYLDYSMTCNPANSGAPRLKVFNGYHNSAISSREIDDPGFAAFKGTQQVYLDGYIIDYDLEKSSFRLHLAKSESVHHLVTSTTLEAKCSGVSFGSNKSGNKHYSRAYCHHQDSTNKFTVLQFSATETVIVDPSTTGSTPEKAILSTRLGAVASFSTKTIILTASESSPSKTADLQEISPKIPSETTNPSESAQNSTKNPKCIEINHKRLLFCQNTTETNPLGGFVIFRVETEPLALVEVKRGSFGMYRDFLAAKLSIPADSFTLTHVPLPTEYMMVFLLSLAGEPNPALKIAQFRGTSFFEDKPFEKPKFVCQVQDFELYSAEAGDQVCVTVNGTFVLRGGDRKVVFLPFLLDGSLLVTDLSRVQGTLISTECIFEKGFWLLNFIELRPKQQDRIHTLLLQGYRNYLGFNDAHRRVRADLKYYFPTMSFAADIGFSELKSPTWISYYDAQSNSLVWHDLPAQKWELSFPDNRTVQYRLNLSPQTNLGIETVEPGNYNCNLTIAYLQYVTETLNTVSLSIMVKPRQEFSAAVYNTTLSSSIMQSVMHVNKTLDLSQHMQVTGPIQNSRLVVDRDLDTYMDEDIGSIALHPRYKLQSTASTPSTSTAFSQLLPLTSSLLLGTRATTLHLLQPSNATGRRSPHFAPVFSYTVMTAALEKAPFDRIEEVKYAFVGRGERGRTGVTGESDQSDQQEQKDENELQGEDEAFLVVVVSSEYLHVVPELLYNTLVKGSRYICVVVFHMRNEGGPFTLWREKEPMCRRVPSTDASFSDLKWGILDAKYQENDETILVDLFAFFPHKTELSQTELSRQSFNYPVDSDWNSHQIYVPLPANHIFPMDTYWNEDDQTYRLIYLVNLGEVLYLFEYGVDISDEFDSFHEVSQQIIPTYNLEGTVLSVNCSVSWQQCVVSLDTNQIVTLNFSYDSKSTTYNFQRSTIIPVHYQHTLPGKIQRIVIGKHHMLVDDDVQGSGVHIYRKGFLEYPHAIIPEEFEAQTLAWFGFDCHLNLLDTCQREVLALVNRNNTAQIFQFTELLIEVKNVPTDFLREKLNLTVHFNMVEELAQDGRSTNVTSSKVNLELDFKYPYSSFSSEHSPSKPILVLCLVLVVVLASLLAINLARYKLLAFGQNYE